MKKRAWDNRGTTLAELLVVIAIVSVLTAVVSLSIHLAYSRDAEQCAKYIQMQLEKTKQLSKAKPGRFVFRVTVTASENYTEIVRDGTLVEKTKLPGEVDICYKSDETLLEDIEKVEISFDKTTGAVTKITQTKEGAESDLSPAVFGVLCEGTRSGKEAALTLVTATGKNKIVYGTGE